LTKRARKAGGVAAPPLSLRAYARRRGCSAEAVSKAIESGRLVKSVVRVRGAPKIGDPDLADAEWSAATDRTRSPVDAVHDGDGDLVLRDELAKAKHWEAKLKEQQFRVRDGELVELEVVEKKVAGVFSRVRTHLLGVPSRAKQLIPHLSPAEVCILEQAIREALTELTEDASEAATG
jgi:phage terminase Nu1 subunit (DNA packaging protein)